MTTEPDFPNDLDQPLEPMMSDLEDQELIKIPNAEEIELVVKSNMGYT